MRDFISDTWLIKPIIMSNERFISADRRALMLLSLIHLAMRQSPMEFPGKPKIWRHVLTGHCYVYQVHTVPKGLFNCSS